MYIVTNRIPFEGFFEGLPSTNAVMETVKNLALPVLGMIALSYVPTVESGCVSYAACITTCVAISLKPPPFWTFDACARSCEYMKIPSIP